MYGKIILSAWSFLEPLARAQSNAAPSGSPAAAQPSILETVFPFIAILFIFWFFMGRPQAKKMKEQQNLLANLKRGDQVVTTSGILGEVTGITEKIVTLQVADNVRIKILKSQIAGLGPLKEGTTA